jgi:succinate dehydrogenase/fumarate reductase flavoprotein subunit
MANNETKLDNVIETDVLVLGSGAAGCGAAMGAKEQGLRVLILDKGKLESSGCIGGGNDHFMANFNNGAEWDTDETVINFFKRARKDVLVEVIDKGWIQVMHPMQKMLEDLGVDFIKNPDGSYLRTVGFGQPGPWWMNIRNGQSVKRRLAKKIRAIGIEVLDHLMTTKLLVQGNRIAGAIGFNVVDGTFYIIKAKTVVMAMGSNANRAMANSTGNPFNSWGYPYNTGSNCVMAYDAGAKVINLDLDHAATLIPKGFGAPGMNGINSMGGHELNALGERFMGKYDPMWENGIRRNQILGTYQEISEGKGPPIFMNMMHLPKEDIELLQNVLMPGDKATYCDYLEQKGIGFATHPLEVEICELAFIGRVLLNSRYESSVEGLFSGCTFDSFSGAICGGYSAGAEAAKSARKMDHYAGLDYPEIAREKELIFRPLTVVAGYSQKSFENIIRQVTQYYMGFVRNQKGLEIAIEKLGLIEKHISEIKASDYHELMRANETRHLLKHCQLTTHAVMERKESGRGMYKRSDYPNINPELDKCQVLWQENGSHKLSFQSLR